VVNDPKEVNRVKILLVFDVGGTHVKVLATGLALRRCSGEPIEQT
jgi:hypothetical protein